MISKIRLKYPECVAQAYMYTIAWKAHVFLDMFSSENSGLLEITLVCKEVIANILKGVA